MARARCAEMIEELAPRGSCDLAVDFAMLFPTEVFLAAFDLGRTLSVVATRTVPTLAVAALVLPLRLPGTLGGLALLAVSLVLAAVVSFQLRFLFASAAFWTPDYRSMFLFAFPVLWLASGFVVPVDFFPDPLRALVDWSPLIPLVMAPVRVATAP